ncbi:MAG: carbon-nitrogen hydrolase family protein [Rhodothalassiaceae bacterium]
MVRIAVLQMTSGLDRHANVAAVQQAARAAQAQGAQMLFTPEMTSCVDRDRDRILRQALTEQDEPALSAFQDLARETGLWLAIGSIPIKGGADDRLRNRSYLIDDQGRIAARYDKIHLFDIDLGGGESYCESATYEGGQTAVLADSPLGPMGLTVCYDLRFPALYEQLALAGARVFAIPSAFTRKTGAAHWHTLLRARAIEGLSFVIAAAQTGRHEDGRATYGHSLVVDPWGRVLLDGGEAPGLHFVDLDLDELERARRTVASLQHRRPFKLERPRVASAVGESGAA